MGCLSGRVSVLDGGDDSACRWVPYTTTASQSHFLRFPLTFLHTHQFTRSILLIMIYTTTLLIVLLSPQLVRSVPHQSTGRSNALGSYVMKDGELPPVVKAYAYQADQIRQKYGFGGSGSCSIPPSSTKELHKRGRTNDQTADHSMLNVVFNCSVVN